VATPAGEITSIPPDHHPGQEEGADEAPRHRQPKSRHSAWKFCMARIPAPSLATVHTQDS